MSVYSQIKYDMDMLEKEVGLMTFYLEKETEAKESIRYYYHTKDIESYDDEVDIVEADFLINVYLANNLNKRFDLIDKALRKLGFYNIKLIDTVKEEKLYNTAFIFLKSYDRRK